MKLSPVRALCLTLLATLFLTANAAPSVIAKRNDRDDQAVQFPRVVQVLQAIVESIYGVVVNNYQNPGPLPVRVPVPTIEPLYEDILSDVLATDEPMINGFENEVLSTPEPQSTSEDAGIPYKLHVIEPTSGIADAAVILLHGLGQTVEAMLPIAEAARFSGIPNVRFIIPQANTKYVTYKNSTMPLWFDITSAKPGEPESRDEILAAAQHIADIRQAQERDYGIPPERVAIVGWSQGGAVALTAYMRYRWAAVVGISTWLPLADSYPAEMTAASQEAPALILHGSEDSMVMPEWARVGAVVMSRLGRKVEFVEMKGEEHWLEGAMARVLVLILSFLRKNLLYR